MARLKQAKHKQRVNLTLDPGLVKAARELAEKHGTSLSALVEATLELEIFGTKLK
jgi:predicted HicB family RNase H-like nuclease